MSDPKERSHLVRAPVGLSFILVENPGPGFFFLPPITTFLALFSGAGAVAIGFGGSGGLGLLGGHIISSPILY